MSDLYRSNEEWDRKKWHLLRSLFEKEPMLSPIRESQEPDAYSPESLPELIVEVVPKRQNIDETEEFYQNLEKQLRDLINLHKESDKIDTEGKTIHLSRRKTVGICLDEHEELNLSNAISETYKTPHQSNNSDIVSSENASEGVNSDENQELFQTGEHTRSYTICYSRYSHIVRSEKVSVNNNSDETEQVNLIVPHEELNLSTKTSESYIIQHQSNHSDVLSNENASEDIHSDENEELVQTEDHDRLLSHTIDHSRYSDIIRSKKISGNISKEKEEEDTAICETSKRSDAIYNKQYIISKPSSVIEDKKSSTGSLKLAGQEDASEDDDYSLPRPETMRTEHCSAFRESDVYKYTSESSSTNSPALPSFVPSEISTQNTKSSSKISMEPLMYSTPISYRSKKKRKRTSKNSLKIKRHRAAQTSFSDSEKSGDSGFWRHLFVCKPKFYKLCRCPDHKCT